MTTTGSATKFKMEVVGTIALGATKLKGGVGAITLDATKLKGVHKTLGVHTAASLQVVRTMWDHPLSHYSNGIFYCAYGTADPETGEFPEGTLGWLEGLSENSDLDYPIPTKKTIEWYKVTDDKHRFVHYKKGGRPPYRIVVTPPVLQLVVEQDDEFTFLLQNHKGCKFLLSALHRCRWHVPKLSALTLMRNDYKINEKNQVVWCGVPPPTPGTLAAAAFPINLTAIQQEHHVYHQARFSMLRRRSFGGLRNDVVDRAARVVNYRPVVSMGRHYRSQDGPCDRDPMEVLFENRAARHVRLQQSIQSKENFANYAFGNFYVVGQAELEEFSHAADYNQGINLAHMKTIIDAHLSKCSANEGFVAATIAEVEEFRLALVCQQRLVWEQMAPVEDDVGATDSPLDD